MRDGIHGSRKVPLAGENPAAAGCVSGDGYTHDTQGVIYDGPDSTFRGREILFSANENTLTIVDVTNKSNPTQLSRSGYSGSGYTHQGWLTESARLLGIPPGTVKTRVRRAKAQLREQLA